MFPCCSLLFYVIAFLPSLFHSWMIFVNFDLFNSLDLQRSHLQKGRLSHVKGLDGICWHPNPLEDNGICAPGVPGPVIDADHPGDPDVGWRCCAKHRNKSKYVEKNHLLQHLDHATTKWMNCELERYLELNFLSPQQPESSGDMETFSYVEFSGCLSQASKVRPCIFRC